MPAKGDGITKRKDGLYMARYTVHTQDGPKRKTVYGRKYKDGESKLQEARGDAARGIVYDDENMTAGHYLDRWLADSVRGTVRESTYSRDSYLVSNHIKPAVGRLRLKNLNAIHLQRLYRDRLNSGLSGATVQKIHHVLHKALSQAVRWNLIPRNPADSVKAPTPTPKEMRPLSATEARRLLAAANEAGDRLEALYVLAVHSGMRRGELLGLKWSDVDLDGRIVRVRRTLTREGTGYALGEPKTKKSRRTVRLTQRAVESLRKHRRRQIEENSRPMATRIRGSFSRAKAAALSIPRTSASGRSGRYWVAPGFRRSPSTICDTPARRSCSRRTYTPSSSKSSWATPPSPSRSTPTHTCCRAWAARPPTRWEKRSASTALLHRCCTQAPAQGRDRAFIFRFYLQNAAFSVVGDAGLEPATSSL